MDKPKLLINYSILPILGSRLDYYLGLASRLTSQELLPFNFILWGILPGWSSSWFFQVNILLLLHSWRILLGRLFQDSPLGHFLGWLPPGDSSFGGLFLVGFLQGFILWGLLFFGLGLPSKEFNPFEGILFQGWSFLWGGKGFNQETFGIPFQTFLFFFPGNRGSYPILARVPIRLWNQEQPTKDSLNPFPSRHRQIPGTHFSKGHRLFPSFSPLFRGFGDYLISPI